MKWSLPILLFCLAGCAARGPQTWRLVPQDRAQVLAPPGVVRTDLAQAEFTAEAASWRDSCAPSGTAVRIQNRGRRIRVSVDRVELLRQTAGWLAQWTAGAEQQGCLALGAGMTVAMRILNSVPLDPAAAFRLLHSGNASKGYTDLGAETRLQVVSPIMRQGADPNAPIVQIGSAAGTDASIQVNAQMPEGQYGVETAWYTLQPRADGNGSRIVAVSAERRINNRVEMAAAPLTNYFQFAPGAAFYRLYYKADMADSSSVTEIIIAAPSRAELDRRTDRLMADLSLCRQSDPEMCMVIPRRVAVNPSMAVTVNGEEVRLSVGSRVRNAVQAGGGPRQLQDVLPMLSVAKPFNGALRPVEFDRTRPDILDLVLLGGESISW